MGRGSHSTIGGVTAFIGAGGGGGGGITETISGERGRTCLSTTVLC